NILGQMNQVIAKPRAELSENAPTMLQMKIDSDKIRDVIGKGGATIRGICEETKASIDIEDDGSVKIYGETKEAAEAAKLRVLAITAEAEIGKIYVGKVERIVDFGAFVNILPGKDGLVHISQISDKRIDKVT
ncbi:S1 RNA-binding domain-containing protein, partial [Klebsiella pneumoniae]